MNHSKNKGPKKAIGIDIGGTKIEASVVSNSGEVLKTIRRPTIKNDKGLFELIHTIVDEIRQGEDILGAGFSIPGSLDPQTKKLRNAPNSPEINGTDFFCRIEQSFTLPVRIENDANCLALSEHHFGAAKGCDNVVGIIMGTGVGGGVITQGRLLHSHRGLAPEVGHTIIDVNGRPCLCGNRGCVEAYLSGPSLLKRYHEAGGNRAVNSAKDLFGLEGDQHARFILDETLVLFDRFMAALTSMYDPEIIVLGGGLSLQDVYYGRGRQIAKYVFGSNDAPVIKKAKLGDASGKLGAAALFF
ncbi:MAG: ROK family protein [Deltaproteobacteria bacterium]|nr:ROK family protein [Deltaproteobacteria bacterium]